MTIRTRYEFNLATEIGQDIPLTDEENARIDELEALAEAEAGNQ